MPRIGADLSLEPSLFEEDYIHETSDDFDQEAVERYTDVRIEKAINKEEDKFEDELRHCDERF